MEDFVGEVPKQEDEFIKCPFCGKGEIRVTHISAYMSWSVNSIASKSIRTKYYHEPRVVVHSKCPGCKAGKHDIAYAISHGGKVKIHEERIEHLKNSGIPTSMEEKFVRDDDD